MSFIPKKIIASVPDQHQLIVYILGGFDHEKISIDSFLIWHYFFCLPF